MTNTKGEKIIVTNEEQVQKLSPYSEVVATFHCTRHKKMFKAKAMVEEGDFKKEARLIDDRCLWFQTESDYFLFCPRCTRAFYTFYDMR